MPKTKRCWLRFSRAALVASLAMLLPGILTVAAVSIHSDANMIVQRLVKVLKQGWQAPLNTTVLNAIWSIRNFGPIGS